MTLYFHPYIYKLNNEVVKLDESLLKFHSNFILIILLQSCGWKRDDGGEEMNGTSGPRRSSGGGAADPKIIATLVIHKDETGFGMKVSGDNPVYVVSVKEGNFLLIKLGFWIFN